MSNKVAFLEEEIFIKHWF